MFHFAEMLRSKLSRNHDRLVSIGLLDLSNWVHVESQAHKTMADSKHVSMPCTNTEQQTQTPLKYGAAVNKKLPDLQQLKKRRGETRNLAKFKQQS